MRVLRILCVITIVIFIFPGTIYGTSHNHWDKLDQISDEALLIVKQERYKEAKQLLTHFSNEFIKISLHDRPYSMDELRIITTTHNNALESLHSSSLTFEDKLQRVTQFRLVIDAIRSEHQPMWSEMEHSIMTTFNQMKETVQKGDSKSYQQHLNVFLNKYETIHPSIKVDIAPETIRKLDSHISFLDHYRHEKLKNTTRLQQMEQMEYDLKALFDKMTEDDADPSLIWVMISIGSVIILTLSYVGWRKYKGDKPRRTPKRENDER